MNEGAFGHPQRQPGIPYPPHLGQQGAPYAGQPPQHHGQQHIQRPAQQHLPDQPRLPAQPAQPHLPQPVPFGTIRLHIQGSVMTSSMIVPTVRINGYQVPSRYGVQDIPVHPGPTRVDIHGQWMRRFGQAEHTAVVAPGQVVELFYAAPWHQFTTGSMGTTTQSRKGLGLMLTLFVAIPLLILLALVVGALR